MSPPRLTFVVESGTDVRLVEGLAERFALDLIARAIPGGVPVSHPPSTAVPTVVGPAGRLAFARFALRRLRNGGAGGETILVQGYGLAALVANGLGRRAARRVVMLVCSPIEAYYACRRGRAYPGKPYRPLTLWGLGRLARLNARVGQAYVVVSEYLATVVRRHGTHRPVHIIPVYGVDTDHFRPADTSREDLRRRAGMPDDGTILFFSSRIAPEKDAETLLRAVRHLLDAGRNVRILHRSGGYRAFLDAAHAVGLERDRVVASDARHPLGGLREDYWMSDVCVQASRAEGLGFSPLEALACGTPVVAASVGGLRETIGSGETGWTYPPGDARALASMIDEVLRSPDEAARRTARGRALVAARFARDRVFTDFERVLRS